MGSPSLRASLNVLAGREPKRAEEAAHRLGWKDSTDDWRSLLEREDVDVIDVLTPGDSHEQIVVAALEAGKHVICEKPLSTDVESAQRMNQAAEAAAARGVRSMVGFNYRHVPALALARQYVQEGRLGTIRHVRAQYLQDFIVDDSFPLTWRLQKDRAGAGALGDIGSHIIDAAQFVSGQYLHEVSGTLETFVRQRPVESAQDDRKNSLAARGGGELGEVTVDDAALFMGRGDDGALMSFEATRMAAGRKNAMRLEVNGSSGSVAFDFESMNELWFHDHELPSQDSGFRRILVTEPEHHRLENWWPAGHGLGYDHTFVHELQEFLDAVADERNPSPSFAEGLQIQRVVEAVQRSSDDGGRFTAV